MTVADLGGTYSSGYYDPLGNQGTSFSAPVVSGAAALWESKYSGIGGLAPGPLYALLLAQANWGYIVDSNVSTQTYGARYQSAGYFTQDNVIGAGMVDMEGGTGSIYTNPITQGQVQSTHVTVPAGTQRLSTAAWWPDRLYTSMGVYVHSHLTLKLSDPNGASPYVSTSGTAVSQRVGISNPLPGTWTVAVTAQSVPTLLSDGTATQTYNIATVVK